MRPALKVFLFGLAMACLLWTSAAFAGGPALYEIGTNDTGLAAAGWAARAQDAATVFTNPAGMTRLESANVVWGVQGLFGDIKFAPNDRTTVDGDDGGYPLDFMPASNLFYVQEVSPELRIGVGMLSYFGSAMKYHGDWAARYYLQEGTLAGLTFTPAAAYRLTDSLSVGIGLLAMYTMMENKVAINTVAERLADGQLKYGDEDWGFGANIGVMFEPFSGTRIGIDYIPEMRLDFKDTPAFSGLSPLLEAALRHRGLLNKQLTAGVTVPDMAMLSVYHDLSPQWSVMGNIGYQQWSEFGRIDFVVLSTDTTSLTTELNYQDTWHTALGFQYHPASEWTIPFGVAFDSTALDEEDVTPSLPTANTWRFGLGVQYQFCEEFNLGVNYELAWMGDIDMRLDRGPLAGTVDGSYEKSSISVLNVVMNWKF